MGIRSNNLSSNYKLIIDGLFDPQKFEELLLNNINADSRLLEKKDDIIKSFKSSIAVYEQTGYFPIKVEDITNFCEKIQSYDARALLVRLRTDGHVSSHFAGKASRLATRSFRAYEKFETWKKLFDLFDVFVETKKYPGTTVNISNQFDFKEEEECYLIKKLLEYYKIQCDFISDMDIEFPVVRYKLSKEPYKHQYFRSYETEFLEDTVLFNPVTVREEIYCKAILCEKLNIKGASEDFVVVKIPEFARLFDQDQYTIRRWLKELEDAKILVWHPTKGAYMLALSKKRYDEIIDKVGINVDESGQSIVPSELQKEQVDYSSDYKVIAEGKDIEARLNKAYDEASKLLSVLSEMTSATAALRQRDAIIYEKSASIDALQQVVQDLQKKVAELTDKNKTLSAERNELREKNRILNHNFDMMCEMLPGRLEEAMSIADQKVLLTVEKYKKRIMMTVRAEVVDQRKADQINNDFIKMNMDISRATHIDVSQNIPRLAKDRKMTKEDFKLDEE